MIPNMMILLQYSCIKYTCVWYFVDSKPSVRVTAVEGEVFVVKDFLEYFQWRGVIYFEFERIAFRFDVPI